MVSQLLRTLLVCWCGAGSVPRRFKRAGAHLHNHLGFVADASAREFTRGDIGRPAKRSTGA